MPRAPLTRALGLALVTVLVAASPAAAAQRWQEETLPFGDVPAREADASAALAPDGRAVFARLAPDGALEIRERAPGGAIGATITLPRATVEPQALPNLQVLAGADGTAAVLFDAGTARYASLRTPGATWTDPKIISPGGDGQAAIAPDGALWITTLAPGDPDAVAAFRMTAAGDVQRLAFPAPRAGARDLAPALTVPTAGTAHVTYVERGLTAAGEDCASRTAVLAVDVPAHGEPLPPTRLDAFDATGAGTPDACHLDAGQLVIRSPLLATDSTGADTAVYSVLSIESSTRTQFARHRERGGTWPLAAQEAAEVVSDTDATAEQLVAGPGAPLAVLRSPHGYAVTSRGDGSWTPASPLPGLEDAAFFHAVRTGAGTTVFAWLDAATPGGIFARVANAAGALGAPVTLAPAESLPLAVGGDDAGDAIALYSRPRGDAFVLAARDYAQDAPPSVPVAPVTPQATPVAEPAATPAADRRAPLISASIATKHPRAGRPAALVLTTDEAGQAQIALTRTAPGVRRGGRCVAPAHRRGAHCTRMLARRTLSRPMPSGSTRVALPRLSAGTWRVVAVVTDAAGNASRPRTLHLRVAT